MKLILLFILFLCSSAQAFILEYDFDRGSQGWEAKFADLPPDQVDFYELESGIRTLPEEVDRRRKGFYISGNNHSDDLYMYMTKKIGRDENISPGTTYKIKYKITFDSNAPTNCFGTGGAPGESVFLKAGAINEPPRTYIDDIDHIRTRFDHQLIVSNIANGIDCEVARGEFKRLVKTQAGETTVRAGKDGSLWLIVGTDSGFESKTTLYYEKIEVSIR